MAVCLIAAPAASAARLSFQPVSSNRYLFFPDTHHGLDWNVFTAPAGSPLSFLDVSDPLPSVAIALPPRVQAGVQTGPSVEQLEQRAFGWIVLIVAGMLAALQLIPSFHTYRARLRALNIHVPVH